MVRRWAILDNSSKLYVHGYKVELHTRTLETYPEARFFSSQSEALEFMGELLSLFSVDYDNYTILPMPTNI